MLMDIMETESVTFYLPGPSAKPIGPYRLRREPGMESDIASHIKDLLEQPPQRLGETAWWIEPPKIPYDCVLLLVRSHALGSWSAAVYIVPIMSKETMSLEGIRNYINEMYGPNAVDGESLHALNEGEGRTYM